MKALCALAVLLSFAVSVRAFDSRDADAAFAAYNANFFAVNNGFAYYKQTTDGGRTHFWVRAEQMEMLEDAYERTHNAAIREAITRTIAGFVDYHGTDWTTNDFNDDIMWMTIACARAYADTGHDNFRAMAKHNFDAVYARAWDANKFGGGLWWKVDDRSKNACVNGPAAIAACLLCQICGDKTYLAKARAIYSWERSTLYNPDDGAIHDNIRNDGHVAHKVFSYNQGTFIGAADLLWKLTGDTNYLSDALLAAQFMRDTVCRGGTLPVYGSGDADGFNGIFMRWLARFVNDDHLWPQFYPWMSANANAAWHVRRADNLSWNDWNTPTPTGTLDSWKCSDTVVILQVVPPKEP